MNEHTDMSIVEARNNLSKIINEVVFAKNRITLNSHGQPKDAIISFEALTRLEEMKKVFYPSRNVRLTALEKATQVRKQIHKRRRANVRDSSLDL